MAGRQIWTFLADSGLVLVVYSETGAHLYLSEQSDSGRLLWRPNLYTSLPAQHIDTRQVIWPRSGSPRGLVGLGLGPPLEPPETLKPPQLQSVSVVHSESGRETSNPSDGSVLVDAVGWAASRTSASMRSSRSLSKMSRDRPLYLQA